MFDELKGRKINKITVTVILSYVSIHWWMMPLIFSFCIGPSGASSSYARLTSFDTNKAETADTVHLLASTR